jgi:hypothetical protein
MSFSAVPALARVVLAVSLALVAAVAVPKAMAAGPSAEAFVAGIYSHYHGSASGAAKGVSIDGVGQLRRYFEPSLANLIVADEARAEKRHEVPTLDGDPFVNAQDWEITDIVTKVVEKGPAHAEGEVHFKNFGEPKTVRLLLVRLPVGWRIHDIVYDDGSTLRGLYVKH